MAMPAVRKHLWTREAFDRMVDVGGFHEDDRLELLDGEIWEMTPQGSHHAAIVDAVQQILRKAFGEGFTARGHSPLALDEISSPEPDIAVVEGSSFDFLDKHPASALLVVEVSDSSLRHDRGANLQPMHVAVFQSIGCLICPHPGSRISRAIRR
jgi:Uma2 family endonuclease